MTNETTNANASQGDDIAKMKAYFEKLKNPNGNGNGKPEGGLKGEDLLRKMFTPRNPNEIFRILPVSTPSEVTQEAYFHVVPITLANGNKQYKKLYCPSHNDELVSKKDANGKEILDQEGKPVMVKPRCPLCEKAASILATQDDSLFRQKIKKENYTPEQKAIADRNKEIWIEGTKWEAKKFHIIKGIDRGIEKDGVKFWRFKDNRRQQGVLDKLIPVLGDYMSVNSQLFYDKDHGADISITVTDLQLPGGGRGTYKDVSAMNYRQPTPLSLDPILIDQWLNDPITWKDVFRKQKAPNVSNEKYLELVAEGNNPYWNDIDPQNKRWVFPNHPDLERLANTRDQNLDADKPKVDEKPQPSINGDNSNTASTYKEDAIQMGAVPQQEAPVPAATIPPAPVEEEKIDDQIDDLPF